MNKVSIYLIFSILVLGIAYKILLTSGGQFIFNMDSARDMIDVREMLVLEKPRLIGQTSGIEGFFNGPGWYLLLSIPFILTSGNPYGAVLFMIILWAIGGYFLMRLLSRYGLIALILGGAFWVSSNYVTLTTLYAYNPNPVLLLTPLFIFLLDKYLKKNSFFSSAGFWLLGGLFFNFEMAAGIFIPPIIFLTILFIKGFRGFKERNFWLGFLFFLITLMPQIFFEVRHEFFMTRSILHFLNNGQAITPYTLVVRTQGLVDIYLRTFFAAFMNLKIITYLFFAILGATIFVLLTKRSKIKDNLLLILLLLICLPVVTHFIMPVNVMPWHMGMTMGSSILFLSAVFGKLAQRGKVYQRIIFVLTLGVVFYATYNLELPKNLLDKKPSLDEAVFANEVAAIDYVYKTSEGKNFRVYTYLPSIMDYPYQYLFWWHGQNKYGYLSKDYSYLPNVPTYIKNKEKFSNGNVPPDSGLVFLIKQADQRGERHLWENNFSHLEFIKTAKIGPLVIETRKEILNNDPK